MRKGAEPIVRTIAALVKTYNFDSEGLPTDEMLSHLELASSLAPVEASLTKILTRVSDARFLATSSAWDAALQFYAFLQRRAPGDAQLAANLAPITEFFAYRHGLVRAKKPTKLQTRAKTKLALAERLAARVRGHAGTPTPAPVVTAPQPAPAPAHPAPSGASVPTGAQG